MIFLLRHRALQKTKLSIDPVWINSQTQFECADFFFYSLSQAAFVWHSSDSQEAPRCLVCWRAGWGPSRFACRTPKFAFQYPLQGGLRLLSGIQLTEQFCFMISSYFMLALWKFDYNYLFLVTCFMFICQEKFTEDVKLPVCSFFSQLTPSLWLHKIKFSALQSISKLSWRYRLVQIQNCLRHSGIPHICVLKPFFIVNFKQLQPHMAGHWWITRLMVNYAGEMAPRLLSHALFKKNIWWLCSAIGFHFEDASFVKFNREAGAETRRHGSM